jgi:hypothetical protein
LGDLTLHAFAEYGFSDLVRQELDRRRPDDRSVAAPVVSVHEPELRLGPWLGEAAGREPKGRPRWR